MLTDTAAETREGPGCLQRSAFQAAVCTTRQYPHPRCRRTPLLLSLARPWTKQAVVSWVLRAGAEVGWVALNLLLLPAPDDLRAMVMVHLGLSVYLLGNPNTCLPSEVIRAAPTPIRLGQAGDSHV